MSQVIEETTFYANRKARFKVFENEHLGVTAYILEERVGTKWVPRATMVMNGLIEGSIRLVADKIDEELVVDSFLPLAVAMMFHSELVYAIIAPKVYIAPLVSYVNHYDYMTCGVVAQCDQANVYAALYRHPRGIPRYDYGEFLHQVADRLPDEGYTSFMRNVVRELAEMYTWGGP